MAAKPTERANGGKNTPSHPLSRELSQRESLWVHATLGVWALPEAFAAAQMGGRKTKAKLAIKAEKEIYLKEKKYVFIIF